MLRLRQRQRTVLIETFREAGNLAAGAMILGQFVGEQPLSIWVFLAGVGLWLALVGVAVLLAGEQR
jgi:hypothetical protein